MSDDREERAERLRETRNERRDWNQSESIEQAEASMDAEDTEKKPIKDRPHRTIYFPEELNEELEDTLKTIIFRSDMDEDIELGKNRHVYPLLMYLGLNEANKKDIDELLEVMKESPMLDNPD